MLKSVSPKSLKNLWKKYPGLIIVGCIFYIVMPLTVFWSTTLFKSNILGWRETTATIIDYSTSQKDWESDEYSPIYQYEVNGSTYQGFGLTLKGSKPNIGGTIIIFYNPRNPSESKEKDDDEFFAFLRSAYSFLTLGPLGLVIFCALIVFLNNIPNKPGQAMRPPGITSLLAFGLMTSLISVYMLWSTGQVRMVFSGWQATTAKVLDYKISFSHSRGRRKHVHPVYQYQVNGETYIDITRLSPIRFFLPDKGDIITIAYNPNQPSDSFPIFFHYFIYGLPFSGPAAVFFWRALNKIVVRTKMKAKLAKAKKYNEIYEGYINELIPTGKREGEFPINDLLIEFYIEDTSFQTTLALPLSERNLSQYGEEPTPILVYADPDDPNNFLVDEEDIYEVTNR